MDEHITPAALAERIAAGQRVGVVDVRDRDEFERWHVDGPGVEAQQVPHAKFLQAQVRGGAADLVDVPEPVVVVCARGEASDHAAELLREAGVDAANLAGGMDAWARVYRALDRSSDGADGAGENLLVRQYHRPATGCLAHLVVADEEAAVVDPLRAFADRYAADAADLGATLRWAVDTHVHADHVSGVRTVAEATAAEAVLPAGSADRGLAFDARLLADGETLPVGAAALQAVHAPGHTTEMTALHLDAAEVLFAGDSLFLDGVARPDLEADVDPETAAARLHETIHERLLALPAETVVAGGHVAPHTPPVDGRYAATLAELRERLDALSLDRAAFVARVTDSLPPRPANAARIVAVNLGRETATEPATLELGPNNCAVTN